MRWSLLASTAVATGVLTLAATNLPATALPAPPPQGKVTVFETEIAPVTTYDNPEGCYKLPQAAHTLINQTDKPVQVYGDPFCMTPSLSVQPGFGSHVAAGSGSFST